MQMWLTDIEIFAVIVAALIHDYEHTGTTNAFHINTRLGLQVHVLRMCLVLHIDQSQIRPSVQLKHYSPF